MEETGRKTEEKVSSASEQGQENTGEHGKKLHKSKGHEDGKLEEASGKEGKR